MSKPVIIVTGVSRGIGEAIAVKLLKSANVIGISRSQKPESVANNENFRYISGDVCDESVCKKAVDLAISEFNRLDGLVFNAGVLEPVSLVANSKTEEWKKLFEINFFSVLTMLTQSIPHLRESKGRVVFVSSGAATSNYRAWGAYGSSKAALQHLAGTLAVEEPNLFSIAVSPGVVDTQMQTNIREQHGTAMGDMHSKFTNLKSSGSLLSPEVPGGIISNLVLHGKGNNLNGKGYRYNSEDLKPYAAEN